MNQDRTVRLYVKAKGIEDSGVSKASGVAVTAATVVAGYSGGIDTMAKRDDAAMSELDNALGKLELVGDELVADVPDAIVGGAHATARTKQESPAGGTAAHGAGRGARFKTRTSSVAAQKKERGSIKASAALSRKQTDAVATHGTKSAAKKVPVLYSN